MCQKLQTYIQATLKHESIAERGKRMKIAAFYGALIASAYVVSNTLVNVLTFPHLPLGVDWLYFFNLLFGIGAVLALIGIIAGWFTEDYEGIMTGGFLLTAIVALAFVIQLAGEADALTLQSLIMAIPLIGINMLAITALRWMARRHITIGQEKDSSTRTHQYAQHMLTIVLVGVVVGIVGRLDLPAEKTLTELHRLLQEAPNNSEVWPRLPIKQAPNLPEHFGVPYRFYVQRSQFAIGTLDLTIRFNDGYALQCLLPVSGSLFFTDCIEASP
jgi:hypothetical protein